RPVGNLLPGESPNLKVRADQGEDHTGGKGELQDPAPGRYGSAGQVFEEEECYPQRQKPQEHKGVPVAGTREPFLPRQETILRQGDYDRPVCEVALNSCHHRNQGAGKHREPRQGGAEDRSLGHKIHGSAVARLQLQPVLNPGDEMRDRLPANHPATDESRRRRHCQNHCALEFAPPHPTDKHQYKASERRGEKRCFDESKNDEGEDINGRLPALPGVISEQKQCAGCQDPERGLVQSFGESEDHQPCEKGVANPSWQSFCQRRRSKGYQRAPEEGEGDACSQEMPEAGPGSQKSQGPEGEDNLRAELPMMGGGVFEGGIPGGVKFHRRVSRPAEEKCRHKNQDETAKPCDASCGLRCHPEIHRLGFRATTRNCFPHTRCARGNIKYRRTINVRYGTPPLIVNGRKRGMTSSLRKPAISIASTNERSLRGN